MFYSDPLDNGDNPRIKIGYVLKRFPRLSETFILNEILELERQGVEIEIYSLKCPLDEPRHTLLADLRAKVHYIKPDATSGSQMPEALIRLLELSSPAKGPSQHAMLASKAALIARLAQSVSVQHLHAHFASDATSAALSASLFAGIPFSFTAHARDIYHRYMSAMADDKARRLKISRAAFVATVSEFNRQHLCELAGQSEAHKIVRIYNGIDPALFTPDVSQPRGRHVLFVGRLVPKKGVHDLISACQLLAQRGVAFSCEIIGDGPLRSTLEQQIDAASLSSRVVLRGALAQNDVISAMHRARVLALPCVIDETGDRDGLPTVLLEALAAGLPVVSTQLAGIPEIIDHDVNGFLVKPSSPSALADAIARILNEDELRNQFVKAGRAKALSAFELSSNVAALRRLFEIQVRAASLPRATSVLQPVASAGSYSVNGGFVQGSSSCFPTG